MKKTILLCGMLLGFTEYTGGATKDVLTLTEVGYRTPETPALMESCVVNHKSAGTENTFGPWVANLVRPYGGLNKFLDLSSDIAKKDMLLFLTYDDFLLSPGERSNAAIGMEELLKKYDSLHPGQKVSLLLWIKYALQMVYASNRELSPTVTELCRVCDVPLEKSKQYEYCAGHNHELVSLSSKIFAVSGHWPGDINSPKRLCDCIVASLWFIYECDEDHHRWCRYVSAVDSLLNNQSDRFRCERDGMYVLSALLNYVISGMKDIKLPGGHEILPHGKCVTLALEYNGSNGIKELIGSYQKRFTSVFGK
ncbi:MAG: hypothetical protein LBB63_02305 [Holosporaceae bacterium]|nr:hypothetical protein [Holosporaceae bacterium]